MLDGFLTLWQRIPVTAAQVAAVSVKVETCLPLLLAVCSGCGTFVMISSTYLGIYFCPIGSDPSGFTSFGTNRLTRFVLWLHFVLMNLP
jgi:hypothetical protein